MRITENCLSPFFPTSSKARPGRATSRANIDNALNFLLKAVHGFLEMVRGKSVLHFACGYGIQAAALARVSDARVVCIDLPRPDLPNRRAALRLFTILN